MYTLLGIFVAILGAFLAYKYFNGELEGWMMQYSAAATGIAAAGAWLFGGGAAATASSSAAAAAGPVTAAAVGSPALPAFVMGA